MQLLLNRVLSFELKFPTTERRWGGGWSLQPWMLGLKSGQKELVLAK